MAKVNPFADLAEATQRALEGVITPAVAYATARPAVSAYGLS